MSSQRKQTPNPINIPQKSPGQQPLVSGAGTSSGNPLNLRSSAETRSSKQLSDPRSRHVFWKQFCSLPEDLLPLLQPDWITNSKNTCLKMYNFLYHFGQAGKLKPKSLRPALINALQKFRPQIQDFCVPETDEAMMEDDTEIDFDPLGKRTTKQMLKATIKKRRPSTYISLNATRDDLLVLYKAYVDSGLVLPKRTTFTKTPRIIAATDLPRKSIEEISFAIHCGAPQIFLHHSLLRREEYVAMYKLFLLEEESAAENLVEGYHYSKISDRM